MEYDDDTRLVNFISGMMLGLAIGAGAAVLLAPASGQKTRKRLKKATHRIKDGTSDRWEEIADDVKGRVDEAMHGARKRFS
jgi:gas vesicle protein